MNLSDAMAQEFAVESATTRKLLERLPEDKLSFKPHERSMTLGRLAAHIAEIPHWAKTIVEDDAFDMATFDRKPFIPSSRKEVLDLFQKNLDAFTKALAGKSNDVLLGHWKLKQGDHVVVDLPRIAALRSFVISHAIHHRGQLSVYLRLNDVPLPSIYGPTADEPISR